MDIIQSDSRKIDLEEFKSEYKSTAPDEKPADSVDLLSQGYYSNNLDIVKSLRNYALSEEESNFQDPDFLENFFNALLSTKIFINFEESLKILKSKNVNLGQRISEMQQEFGGISEEILREKLDFEHEQRIIKETRLHLNQKEREIETDTEELQNYIEFEKKKLEDKKKSFNQMLKKSTKIEIKTNILKMDNDCYGESLKEFTEKVHTKETELGDKSKELGILKNKLSLSETQYYNLLKEYQEKILMENSLETRMKSLLKLKEELSKKYEEIQLKIENKIKEIEQEEERIKEAEETMELEPMKFEKILEEKTRKFTLLKIQHCSKKTKVEVMRKELENLEKRIEEIELETKKEELNELQIKEKIEEYNQIMDDYLNKTSKQKDLKKKYDFHCERIKELTNIYKESVKSSEEELSESLHNSKDIIDQSFIDLTEISKGVKEIGMRIEEVIVKQEQMNTANQNSLKAMGIYSNFGSINTSNYEYNVENSEKSKDLNNIEEMGKMKEQLNLINEKIENLQNDLSPHMKSVSKFITKNQILIEQKLNKFMENIEKRVESEDVGNEICKIVKEDFRKVIEDVVNSKSCNISSERFSIKSNMTNAGTVILHHQKSPNSEVFSEKVFNDFYGHKNSDYYHIMQFIFKMASLFVNTIADLIKDNRNYHYLREDVIK